MTLKLFERKETENLVRIYVDLIEVGWIPVNSLEYIPFFETFREYHTSQKKKLYLTSSYYPVKRVDLCCKYLCAAFSGDNVDIPLNELCDFIIFMDFLCLDHRLIEDIITVAYSKQHVNFIL